MTRVALADGHARVDATGLLSVPCVQWPDLTYHQPICGWR